MIILFKILILIGLLQLLYRTEKPFMCSGIYSGIIFFGSLLLGAGLTDTLVGTAIVFVLSSVYFWLLNEFKDGILHWGIMIGGMLIGLV